jgi:hypothetical protein
VVELAPGIEIFMPSLGLSGTRGKRVNVRVFGRIANAASCVKEDSAQFALVDPHGGVQTRRAVTLDRFGGYVFTTALQASGLGSGP